MQSQAETAGQSNSEVNTEGLADDDTAPVERNEAALQAPATEEDLAPWEEVGTTAEQETKLPLESDKQTVVNSGPGVPQEEPSSESALSSQHFVIEPYEPESSTTDNLNLPNTDDNAETHSSLSDVGYSDADVSDVDFEDRGEHYQGEDGYYGMVDVDEEEEDYHELFAGPVPKVSVDFEIPYKVSGKKVVKASQLDTWSQLIEQSGIGGLNKQLALHSNYVLQGDNVKLIVSEHQKHLFTDTALAAIEEALSETLQHDVHVSAHIGEVIDTPAAVQYAINNMRQEYAVKTIQQDSGVKALCDAFSGTVLNETIEPR